MLTRWGIDEVANASPGKLRRGIAGEGGYKGVEGTRWPEIVGVEEGD